MKVGMLFSGGKDSAMASYKALEEGHHIKYLVSIFSHNPASYMYHVPNIHLVELSSEAMGIPLIKGVTQGNKEEELKDLKMVLRELKENEVEGIFSGALASTYQKSRIDKICHELQLKSFTPLWQRNPKEYMEDIIELGFEVIITSVSAEGLDEYWLGRKLNYELLDEIITLNDKHGIHLAFEGGEAETLVLDGPIFGKRIRIIEAEKIWDRISGHLSIKKAVLEEK